MAAQIDRGQTGLMATVPAPTGGLNARDALADMPPTDASAMDNLFARTDRVDSRAGYVTHGTATTISASNQLEGLQHLMVYSAGGAEDQVLATQIHVNNTGATRGLRVLLVASNGTITTSHDVVAPASGVLLESVGEWTQFGSLSGTNYLLFPTVYGGAWKVQAYDGTTWTEPAITNGSAYLGVHSHMKRLWFYNSTAAPLTVSYLPVGAIAGNLVDYPLAVFASKGGRIVSMRTVTRDGGDGSDDLALFLTNRGQAFIFQGTDPASSSTWGLVGVFDIAQPAAAIKTADSRAGTIHNCIRDSHAMKYGADVLLNLRSGLSSATAIMSGVMAEKASLTPKIQPLLSAMVATWDALSTANVGSWKLCHIPGLRQLVLTTPISTNTSGTPPATVVSAYWWVMNTETGAWHRFTGLNARDMVCVGGSTVYFIDGSNTVYKYDGTATTDNGSSIGFSCRPAYNYLGVPNNKQVGMVQPMLYGVGNFTLSMMTSVDFTDTSTTNYVSYTGAQNVQPKIAVSKYGRAIAPYFAGTTSTGTVSWYATNYFFTPARGY